MSGAAAELKRLVALIDEMTEHGIPPLNAQERMATKGGLKVARHLVGQAVSTCMAERRAESRIRALSRQVDALRWENQQLTDELLRVTGREVER
jgi:hypothetical protein